MRLKEKECRVINGLPVLQVACRHNVVVSIATLIRMKGLKCNLLSLNLQINSRLSDRDSGRKYITIIRCIHLTTLNYKKYLIKLLEGFTYMIKRHQNSLLKKVAGRF